MDIPNQPDEHEKDNQPLEKMCIMCMLINQEL
jgi:hypothetical protein